MKKAFEDVMSLFLGNIGGILLSLPIAILLARLLGPSDFGVLSLLLSLRDIFCVVTSLGLGRAALYFLARGREEKGYFSSLFFMRLLFGLIGALIFFSASTFFEEYYGIDRFALYAKIMSVDVVLSGLFSFFLYSFNGLSEFKRSAVMNVFYNFLRISSVVFVLLNMGVLGAIGGYLLSSFVTLILSTYFLSDLLVFLVDRLKVREIMNYSISAYFIDVSHTVANLVPLTILGLFGSVIVGYFSAAWKVASVISLFLGAMNAVGVQRISSKKSSKERKKVARKLTKYVVYLSSFFAFMMIPFSSQVINIVFSESFAPASLPLIFLSASFFLKSLSAGAVCYLLGTGKPKPVTKSLLISALLAVLLSTVLIPSEPLLGISLVFLVVSCVYSLMLSFTVKFISYKNLLLRSLLSGIVTAVVVKLIVQILPTVPSVILGGFSGLFVFLTMLFLLNGLEEEDIELFSDLFEAVRKYFHLT